VYYYLNDNELRIKLTGTQVRILYFFCYRNILILTNIFDKHTKQVPKAEIKIAKDRRADFLSRFSENDIRSNKGEKFQKPSQRKT
jgi:phage-related protein